MQWHHNVTLCVDVCFACGIPFLHTISKHLQFRTIQFLLSQTYKQLLSHLHTVLNLYFSWGFNVNWIHRYGQFKCIHETIHPTLLHTAAPEQHIPEVERSIRTLKDDVRTTIHGLPYTKYTRLMLKSLDTFICKICSLHLMASPLLSVPLPLSLVTTNQT